MHSRDQEKNTQACMKERIEIEIEREREEEGEKAGAAQLSKCAHIFVHACVRT